MRRRLGLCVRCAQPVEGNAACCADCKPRANANNRAQRCRHMLLGEQEDRCHKGHRPRIGLTVLCEWHYLQNRAKLALGSTSFASAIHHKRVEQDFRCHYTGVPLVLGINDSLDHVLLSIAKHPDLRSRIDNIVWCTREINTMKNSMEAEEFLALCHLISSRWPS